MNRSALLLKLYLFVNVARAGSFSPRDKRVILIHIANIPSTRYVCGNMPRFVRIIYRICMPMLKLYCFSVRVRKTGIFKLEYIHSVIRNKHHRCSNDNRRAPAPSPQPHKQQSGSFSLTHVYINSIMCILW